MPSLRTLPSDLRVFAKYHLVRRVVDHPAPETGLGVVELEFDLDSYVEGLSRFGDTFDIEVAARVRYREREHPIAVATSKADAAAPCLLVLAGVHGNERAGLLAVPRILEAVSERDPTTRLIVVTPVNPVGAAELSRYNANGYDINRDFVRFDTPEARLVRDVIERERPDFIVSLHEGPQDATFMFTNQHVGIDVSTALLESVERGGTTLAERDYFGRRLRTRGLAPSSRTLRAVNALWARTLQMMTTGTFAERRGIPEITLESSWRQSRSEARIRPHVDLVVRLAEWLGTP